MPIICQHCKGLLSTNDNEYLCRSTDPDACQPCRKVAELDDRIQRLWEAIVEAEEERQKWKEHVNEKHDELANRIPPEIMSAIFEFCLPVDVWNIRIDRETSRYTLAAPLVLSAVSQRWRHIAQSTPQLWSDITLRLAERNIGPQLTLAREWLERSGRFPLSFNICTGKNTNPKLAHQLIKMVCRYSSRWKTLKYDGDSTNLSYFSSEIEGVSTLQTLHLNARTPRSGHQRCFDLGKFILQPKLLVIERLFSLSEIKIDWNHLTELVIDSHVVDGGLSGYECLEALRRAPRLTKCTLCPFRNQRSTFRSPPREPILHPNILDLTLLGDNCDVIFSHLRCPSLETFTLSGFQRGSPVEDMVVFLRESKCSIMNLTIRSLYLRAQGQDLDLLCQAMPTLCHLHIEQLGQSLNQLNDTFLSLLADVSDLSGEIRPRYLPELRSLAIHQYKPMNLALVPLVFSLSPGKRACHRTKLESVDFVFTDAQANLIYTTIGAGYLTLVELAWLKKQGVNLEIHLGQDRKEMDIDNRISNSSLFQAY